MGTRRGHHLMRFICVYCRARLAHHVLIYFQHGDGAPCMLSHVPKTTASMSGSAMTSVHPAQALGMSSSSAAGCEDSRLRLQMSTTSTFSCARRQEICLFHVLRPAPMTATRIGVSGMNSSYSQEIHEPILRYYPMIPRSSCYTLF